MTFKVNSHRCWHLLSGVATAVLLLFCLIASGAASPAFDAEKITGAAPMPDVYDHVIEVPSPTGSNETLVADALRQALKHLRKGESVIIRLAAGTYREGQISLDTSGSQNPLVRDTPLAIVGHGPQQTVISGSEVLSVAQISLVRDEAGKVMFYEAEWPRTMRLRGGAWGKHGPSDVVVHRQEQLFINGHPLRQVEIDLYDYDQPAGWGGRGSHTLKGHRDPSAALAPGTFGVTDQESGPRGGNKLFFRPAEAISLADVKIEVAVEPWLMRISGKNYIKIEGIGFEHAADEMEVGAALRVGHWIGDSSWRGEHVTIENCEFRWNNNRGIALTNLQHLTVQNVRSNHNGLVGVTLYTIRNLLWEDNETSFNNWRGEMGQWRGWAVAGLKAHVVHDGIFRRHRAVNNRTRGLWFDIANTNILVDEYVGIGNFRGLFIEISPGPILITRSFVAGDYDVNLHLSNATHIEVQDSIFLGTGSGGEAFEIVASNRKYFDTVEDIDLSRERLTNLSTDADAPKDDRRIEIGTGPMTITNSIIAHLPDNSTPLIHLRNGKPDQYTDFLNNRLHLDRVAFWSPVDDTFGIGFKANNMVDLDGFSKATNITATVFTPIKWHDPASHDYTINQSMIGPVDVSRLPKVTLSAEERVAMRDFNDFMPIQGGKDKGFEVGD